MVPNEGGLSIKIIEKMVEDLAATLFVSVLFFALSGIDTNFSILDSGVVCAYTVWVCDSGCLLQQLFGGTVGAQMNGLVWRSH